MINPQDLLQQYLQQQQQVFGDVLYFADDVPPNDKTVSTISSDILKEQMLGKDVEQREHSSHTSTSMFNPPPLPASMFDDVPAWSHAMNLDVLYNEIHTCEKCRLGTSRTNFVFGSGNPTADIVIIGEAPGADEDAQGQPFVGRAGQLLTKILEAINLSRDEVYICNILKCRPPENRRPLADEVEQCEPYLYKQLALIQPKFILALGLTAAETLLKNKYKMAELRGSWLDYYGARLMVTYHPAALLRNPEWKKFAWEDVQLLRKCYDHFQSSGELPEYGKI